MENYDMVTALEQIDAYIDRRWLEEFGCLPPRRNA